MPFFNISASTRQSRKKRKRHGPPKLTLPAIRRMVIPALSQHQPPLRCPIALHSVRAFSSMRSTCLSLAGCEHNHTLAEMLMYYGMVNVPWNCHRNVFDHSCTSLFIALDITTLGTFGTYILKHHNSKQPYGATLGPLIQNTKVQTTKYKYVTDDKNRHIIQRNS